MKGVDLSMECSIYIGEVPTMLFNSHPVFELQLGQKREVYAQALRGAGYKVEGAASWLFGKIHCGSERIIKVLPRSHYDLGFNGEPVQYGDICASGFKAGFARCPAEASLALCLVFHPLPGQRMRIVMSPIDIDDTPRIFSIMNESGLLRLDAEIAYPKAVFAPDGSQYVFMLI
jgi:hypothetical protein